MSLLETMEFLFCDDIIVEYRDGIIVVLNRYPYDDRDRAIAYHGVAKC